MCSQWFKLAISRRLAEVGYTVICVGENRIRDFGFLPALVGLPDVVDGAVVYVIEAEAAFAS